MEIQIVETALGAVLVVLVVLVGLYWRCHRRPRWSVSWNTRSTYKF